jgi:uncharacterized repeat protein (TIGR04076 family)
MAKPAPVRVTITEIMGTGKCSQGHKVGDSWLIKKNMTPTDLCMSAFATMYPAIRTLRYGGGTPWSKPGITHIACPDPKHVVVFELLRINPEDDAASDPGA